MTIASANSKVTDSDFVRPLHLVAQGASTNSHGSSINVNWIIASVAFSATIAIRTVANIPASGWLLA